MAISPTSSGTSNFNFDGVVSGLNTTDIIDKLMSLESAPLTHLAQPTNGEHPLLYTFGTGD